MKAILPTTVLLAALIAIPAAHAATLRHLPGTVADINNAGHIAITRWGINEINIRVQFAYIVDTAGNEVEFLGGWGRNTTVTALNDAGQTACSRRGLTDQGYAFRFANNLGYDLASGNAIKTEAAAINAAGRIAGTTTFPPTSSGGDWNLRATVWDGTAASYLPATEPGLGGGAHDINAAGQVAGFETALFRQAVRWDNGVPTRLPGTWLDSEALAINDSGWAVGYITEEPETRIAALWQGDTFVALGTGATAYGINAGGDIVGEASGRATLWRANGTSADLNTYRPAWMVQQGMVLERAVDINDAGDIVGLLYVPGASQDERHASFVLTGAVTARQAPAAAR